MWPDFIFFQKESQSTKLPILMGAALGLAMSFLSYSKYVQPPSSNVFEPEEKNKRAMCLELTVTSDIPFPEFSPYENVAYFYTGPDLQIIKQQPFIFLNIIMNAVRQEARQAIVRDDQENFWACMAKIRPQDSLNIVTFIQPGFSSMNSLLYSARCGSIKILSSILESANQLLLQSFDDYHQNVMMNAILSDKIAVVRLVQAYVPQQRSLDSDDNTYMHIAAAVGNLQILELCTQSQFLLNQYGQSPLHFASSADIINHLIKIGASVNQQDYNGWTPLHHSVYYRRDDCVRALLEQNPDISIRNCDYQTCYDLCVNSGGNTEIFKQYTLRRSKTHVKPNRVELVESEGEVSQESPTRNASVFFSGLLQTSLKLPEMSNFGIDAIQYNQLQFQGILGKGGFGKVYKGVYRQNDVAIKMIINSTPKIVQNFIKEIQMLLKLRHPRFLLLLGVCTEPLCIVTELAKGGNLMEAIKQNEMSEQNKLRIAVQLADGLCYIHSKSPPIIHRDIKPQNILLDEFKTQAKFADLGLSRNAVVNNNTGCVQNTDICTGTVRYMAPQLYDEKPMCSRATDVWAFGCVLLHMFSGERPWGELEVNGIQRKLVLKQSLPINSGIPEEIRQLLERCSMIKPQQRPKATEIRQSLMLISKMPMSQQ